MSQRSISFTTGEFYHVYNRGNSKQVIFKDDDDYKRFQLLLKVSNNTESLSIDHRERTSNDLYQDPIEEPLVAIAAYCLMPNHFHILLKPLVEDGVSQFMQKLGTGYVMYFNKKYERTGSLFEGKFKAVWVDSDRYLKYLYAYIHLNPQKLFSVKTKSEHFEKVSQYPYSSYQDYCNKDSRREACILKTDIFPYSKTDESIHTDMKEWFLDRQGLSRM